MFDAKAEIVQKVFKDGEIVRPVVRFPTDDEYITWRRKKKVQQTQLGRGNYEMTPAKPESADLALYKAIQVDKDGPVIDQAEAFVLVNQLFDCDIPTHPEQEGKTYVVEMKAMNRFDTLHTLKVPSMQQMTNHHGASVINGAYNTQDIRLNPQSSCDLYNELVQRTEGYVGNIVPAVHKVAVINAFLQEVREAMKDTPESDDEDQD